MLTVDDGNFSRRSRGKGLKVWLPRSIIARYVDAYGHAGDAGVEGARVGALKHVMQGIRTAIGKEFVFGVSVN